MLPAAVLLFGFCCVTHFNVLDFAQQTSIFKASSFDGVCKNTPLGDGGHEILLCNYLHLA
jgi:hypothetical protein